jgi:hypothetical protein
MDNYFNDSVCHRLLRTDLLISWFRQASNTEKAKAMKI